MSDQVAFFAMVTAIDFVGAAYITYGLFTNYTHHSSFQKFAFVVALLGLLAQGFRNLSFLFTGVSPSDADLPLWVLKDIGITLAFASMVRDAKT
jgi:hypothetical protein